MRKSFLKIGLVAVSLALFVGCSDQVVTPPSSDSGINTNRPGRDASQKNDGKTEVETREWKTYENEQYKFSFNYPSDWIARLSTGPLLGSLEIASVLEKEDMSGTGVFYTSIIRESFEVARADVEEDRERARGEGFYDIDPLQEISGYCQRAVYFSYYVPYRDVTSYNYLIEYNEEKTMSIVFWASTPESEQIVKEMMATWACSF